MSKRKRLRAGTHHAGPRFLALMIGILLMAGACARSDDADSIDGGAAALGTSVTDIGEVLVSPDGLTLYGFINDVDGETTCFDGCSTAWPPLSGDTPVSAAIELLGFDAVDRGDGSTQLRVAGRWPLYTFAGDEQPGDVAGQESGGVWFAVSAKGNLIGLDGGLVGAITGTDTDTNTDTDTDTDTNTDTSSAADDGADDAVTSSLGPILTDQDGLTAYVFANDTAGRSNCADPCSVTWPAIPTSAVLSPKIDAGRYGSVLRDDGIDQTTLDGFPLYTFKDDAGPGDVEGQNVGDVWFAVSASGQVIVPPGMRVGSTDAGDVLIDTESFTVYQFADDSHGVSRCNDACSETWPPVPGDIRLGPGLDSDQFGQITREDGTTQLTFLQHPLYGYRDDDNPGDANGLLVGDDGTWSAIGLDRLTVIESDETFGTVIGTPSGVASPGDPPAGDQPAGGDGYGGYGSDGGTTTLG